MGMAISLLKAPYVGIRELKENLSSLLKKAVPLVITDHGQPASVILPYNEVVELLDMIDELNDKELRALIESGRKSIAEGVQGIPVFPAANTKVNPKGK